MEGRVYRWRSKWYWSSVNWLLQRIFSRSPQVHPSLEGLDTPSLDKRNRLILEESISCEEIKEATFSFPKDKSPGDGFFSKCVWIYMLFPHDQSMFWWSQFTLSYLLKKKEAKSIRNARESRLKIWNVSKRPLLSSVKSKRTLIKRAKQKPR